MSSVRSKRSILWRDISPEPLPLVRLGPESPRSLIVGGGVTGLITAWTLLDHGYKVTVLAKEWPT
jgi:D-amino-acid oxidase